MDTMNIAGYPKGELVRYGSIIRDNAGTIRLDPPDLPKLLEVRAMTLTGPGGEYPPDDPDWFDVLPLDLKSRALGATPANRSALRRRIGRIIDERAPRVGGHLPPTDPQGRGSRR